MKNSKKNYVCSDAFSEYLFISYFLFHSLIVYVSSRFFNHISILIRNNFKFRDLLSMASSDSENDEEFGAWSKLTTEKSWDGCSYISDFIIFSGRLQVSYFFLVTKGNETNWLIQRKSTDEIDGAASSKIIDTFHQTTPYSLLVQSLIKQLCYFLEKDKEQSTQLYNKICAKLFEMKFIDESYERSEFESIRVSYEMALSQLVEATRGQHLGNALPLRELEVWPLMDDNKALDWSRYYRDFEEIEKIGEGGFGDVWKSKHKLDQIDYAVKKICVKATSVKNVLNHLREVKTLASLNHVNIVPYKSCWLEPLISFQEKEGKPIDTYQSSSSDESSNFVSQTSLKVDSLRLKSDSFSIDFEYSQEQEKSESISRLEKIRRLKNDQAAMIPHVKITWAVLYIQMKLCQKTMRHFLDERNEHSDFQVFYKQLFISTDNEACNQQIAAFSIFHQLCSGLDYIHGKGIVHHDIKPSNVFISTEESGGLTLQLGDFGLACPLENNEVIRHDGFGTRLYAAKEQLDGECSKKSDIYSLGVILIELLSKCITVMECYKKVEKLKKGELLSEIEEESCALISRLLSNQPHKRPDIAELKAIIKLKLASTSNEVDRLKKVISEQSDTIQKKDQQIDELMHEISQLRRQISNT